MTSGTQKLLLAMLLLLVLALALSVAGALALADVASDGLNISVNGETFALDSLSEFHLLGLSFGMGVTLLVVLVVVPLAATVGIVVAAFAALLGCWPLLLLAGLWLLLRRKRAPSTTMAG
jgi:hypothetical protein